jgi:hypothetical protein
VEENVVVRDVVTKAHHLRRICRLFSPNQGISSQPHCPIHAFKRLCWPCLSSRCTLIAAPLRRNCTIHQMGRHGCQISSCYAKDEHPCDGSRWRPLHRQVHRYHAAGAERLPCWESPTTRLVGLYHMYLRQGGGPQHETTWPTAVDSPCRAETRPGPWRRAPCRPKT